MELPKLTYSIYPTCRDKAGLGLGLGPPVPPSGSGGMIVPPSVLLNGSAGGGGPGGGAPGGGNRMMMMSMLAAAGNRRDGSLGRDQQQQQQRGFSIDSFMSKGQTSRSMFQVRNIFKEEEKEGETLSILVRRAHFLT